MKTIALGREAQHTVMVSDEDYDFLMRWRWNFKRSSGKHYRLIYARRGGGRTRSGVTMPTILMHTVILLERMGKPRPSPMHTVDHRDTNTLNNQRWNLCWATKSEQNLNQKRYQVEEPVDGLGTIPY